MADLFDMNVGGAGFHLTSHVIAIAALFIACFAIAGYITFRKDSIPGDALKDHDANFDDVTLTSVFNGAFYEKGYDVTLTATAVQTAVDDNDVLFATPLASGLPAGTQVVVAKMDVLNAMAADCGPFIGSAAAGTLAGAATNDDFSGDLGNSSAVSSTLISVAGDATAQTDATNSSLFLAAASGASSALAVGDSIRVRFTLRSPSPL